MQIKVNKEIEFVLSVTFKEAEWLRDYLCNYDKGKTAEDQEGTEMRVDFWKMLDRAIQEHH